MQASKTQIFGYLGHLLLLSYAFFKAQMWQKAEEYVLKYVCQDSTAKVIVTGKIHQVLQVNFECFLANRYQMHMHAFKTKILVQFGHCFAS